MSGTHDGGVQAAATNKQRYGLNFYRQIGQAGGKVSRGGGFATQKRGTDGLTGVERASAAGRIGGKLSRRSWPVAPFSPRKTPCEAVGCRTSGTQLLPLKGSRQIRLCVEHYKELGGQL